MDQKHTNWGHKSANKLFKLKRLISTELETQPLNVFQLCMCIACDCKVVQLNKTQCLLSARESYWPSDRHMSAKCQLLRIESVAWSAQQQVARQLSSRGWVDPFQTHYFSENLVAPGIEPGISGSVARNWPLDHKGGPNLIKLYMECCVKSVNT
jgi:hypothetical protein